MPQREIGERVAAIEMELRMRGPKNDELERSMEGLTRQMDRVVLLGEQALKDIKDLRDSHVEAIGTLTRGQQRLRTEFRAHINRSLIDILKQRSREIAYSAAIASLLGLQFPEVREGIKEEIRVVIPNTLLRQ